MVNLENENKQLTIRIVVIVILVSAVGPFGRARLLYFGGAFLEPAELGNKVIDETAFDGAMEKGLGGRNDGVRKI